MITKPEIVDIEHHSEGGGVTGYTRIIKFKIGTIGRKMEFMVAQSKQHMRMQHSGLLMQCVSMSEFAERLYCLHVGVMYC